jgi:proteic killer suppression protein
MRQLPADVVKVGRRKLDMINAATVLGDLAVPPGNRLEALRGERVGYCSIRINVQWPIVFRWGADNAAYDVTIEDYH